MNGNHKIPIKGLSIVVVKDSLLKRAPSHIYKQIELKYGFPKKYEGLPFILIADIVACCG